MNAGAWAGLLAGFGAALVVAGVPWRREPSLAARVVPYLAPRRTRSRDLLRALAAAVGERLGSGRVVTERLTVLTPHTAVDLPGYRAQQVLWACGATAAALVAVWAGAGANPVAVVAAMVVGAAGGALARDELLARAVRRRRGELVADLPAVAELLALSVAAGENVAAALERVAAGHGPLCAGLRGALGRVRTGTPLLDALSDLAGRWQVPPFSRFADAICVAVEAGSPLADVLRAQVADARDAEHRRLVETGGRQEVRMMVPVVFGILPTVVVFAVYPGLAQLDLAT
ncbi:type II secretion system F family protein [Kineococcus sp. SYSU DK001]|uniref:type II secretion system F family protein n=1 Tax=Kineococcus sp. SYSU DK001 TaxID=3383122 RepID=UPI003D7E9A3A